MPFLGDGYPEEWIETLNALEQLVSPIGSWGTEK
jgi:hypothetical protein